MLKPKILFIHMQKNYDTMSGVETVRHVAREQLGQGYCTRLYYSRIGISRWRVDFAILLNLESHVSIYP